MFVRNLTGFFKSKYLIDIEGYNLVHADHPDDTKRDRVCIYYQESLPVKTINLPYF